MYLVVITILAVAITEATTEATAEATAETSAVGDSASKVLSNYFTKLAEYINRGA